MAKLRQGLKQKGVKTRTHECSRCHRHTGTEREFTRRSGRRFNLCRNCAKSLGKE